jgi:hypothetical protein
MYYKYILYVRQCDRVNYTSVSRRIYDSLPDTKEKIFYIQPNRYYLTVWTH